MTTWLMIATLLLTCLGCGGGGGLTQEELKRRAIKRPKDDEPAPPPATSVAGESPSPATDKDASQDPAPQPMTASDVAAETEGNSAQQAAEQLNAPPVGVKPDAPLSALERRERTIQNLERIAVALEQYLKKNGAYPAATIHLSGRPLLSWRVELLPYLGYEALYKQFHRNEPWDSPHNRQLLGQVPEPFQSPERFDERTNYLAIVGAAFAFSKTHGRMLSQIEDGVINTALVVEVDESHAVPWTAPQDFEPDPEDLARGLGKLREDGFFMVWGGGTVGQIISGDVNSRKLYPMLSIAGGENFLYSDLHRPAKAELPRPDDEKWDTTVETAGGKDEASDPSLIDPDSAAAATPAKTSPPDAAAETAAMATLREIFEPQLKEARQRSQRVALAREMLLKAEGVSDEPSRFAMLKVVARLAAESGDVKLARESLEKLEARYAYDVFTLWTELLRMAGKVGAGDPQALLDSALDAAEQAVMRDEFELARAMHGLAASSAQQLRSDRDRQRVQQARRRIDQAQRAFQGVVQALARLDASPLDPAANTAVGTYYCLVKADWPRGLTFLAKSEDVLLATAAKGELNNPANAEEMAGLGDAWWSYGETQQAFRRAAQLRAVYWYLRVIEQDRSGISGIKAEVRLQQAERSYGREAVQEIRERFAPLASS